MTCKYHWFLPTASDGRTLSAGTHRTHGPGIDADAAPDVNASRFRAPTLEYLSLVAEAAEQNGFESLLTPTGTFCEDAWLTSAALVSRVSKIKFMVALRPGLISPTLAAQMASTLQRVSGGRLLLNVVTGGDRDEQARFGDHVSKDERYARTGEFLDIVRGAWRGGHSSAGTHYSVTDARTLATPSPTPSVYFGGSSAAAGPIAARFADVYLTWGESPEAVRCKLDWIRGLAQEAGREVRFGIRFHLITRDSSAEAWSAASGLLRGMDRDQVGRVQTAQSGSESTGQNRMRQLTARFRETGDPADLQIYPNVWSGIGLLRSGAGSALVGHNEVADRIQEYAELGISEFILSGFPHVEEAFWAGEGLLPELRRRGLADAHHG
jgi:alkanesulfonate monooxygenase